MGEILKAMHIKEVQLAMDKAMAEESPVSIRAVKSNGEWVDYTGWLVIGSHWRGGNHRLKNPLNGEIRTLPDVCIKYFNGRRMYL